jgi:hypothetical protein
MKRRVDIQTEIHSIKPLSRQKSWILLPFELESEIPQRFRNSCCYRLTTQQKQTSSWSRDEGCFGFGFGFVTKSGRWKKTNRNFSSPFRLHNQPFKLRLLHTKFRLTQTRNGSASCDPRKSTTATENLERHAAKWRLQINTVSWTLRTNGRSHTTEPINTGSL